MLSALPSLRAIDVLDILFVAFVVYWILLFIRGTRAVQILLGLFLLLAVFVLSRRIGMVTFQWLVGNVLGSLIVIIVVVFQSEIRRGLAKVGQARIFGRPPGAPPPAFLDELAQTAFLLSETRTGAILVIERSMGLSEYVEHGRKLDALFSQDLMAAILCGVSPVHDGAVIIRGERVAAAGVILPIPAESQVTRTMGTRHRAAWGVASETDAVAVVVSEETGNVTVFHDRQLTPVSDMWALRRCLAEIFGLGKAA